MSFRSYIGYLKPRLAIKILPIIILIVLNAILLIDATSTPFPPALCDDENALLQAKCGE